MGHLPLSMLVDKLDCVGVRARNAAISLFMLAGNPTQEQCVLTDVASKLLAIAGVIPCLCVPTLVSHPGHNHASQRPGALWQHATAIQELCELTEMAVQDVTSCSGPIGHTHTTDVSTHPRFNDAQRAASSVFKQIMSSLSTLQATVMDQLRLQTNDMLCGYVQTQETLDHRDCMASVTVNNVVAAVAPASIKDPHRIDPSYPQTTTLPTLPQVLTQFNSRESPTRSYHNRNQKNELLPTTPLRNRSPIMTPASTDESPQTAKGSIAAPTESNPATRTSSDISSTAEAAREIGIDPAAATSTTSPSDDISGHLEAYVLRPLCKPVFDTLCWSYEIKLLPLREEQIDAHLRKLGSEYSVLDALGRLLPEQLRLITSHVETRQGHLLSFVYSREADMVTQMGTFKVQAIAFVLRTSSPPESGGNKVDFGTSLQHSGRHELTGCIEVSEKDVAKEYIHSLKRAGNLCRYFETDPAGPGLVHYQAVTFMPEQRNLSFEELRLADKAADRASPRFPPLHANKFGVPQTFDTPILTNKGLAQQSATPQSAASQSGKPRFSLFGGMGAINTENDSSSPFTFRAKPSSQPNLSDGEKSVPTKEDAEAKNSHVASSFAGASPAPRYNFDVPTKSTVPSFSNIFARSAEVATKGDKPNVVPATTPFDTTSSKPPTSLFDPPSNTTAVPPKDMFSFGGATPSKEPGSPQHKDVFEEMVSSTTKSNQDRDSAHVLGPKAQNKKIPPSPFRTTFSGSGFFAKTATHDEIFPSLKPDHPLFGGKPSGSSIFASKSAAELSDATSRLSALAIGPESPAPVITQDHLPVFRPSKLVLPEWAPKVSTGSEGEAGKG